MAIKLFLPCGSSIICQCQADSCLEKSSVQNIFWGKHVNLAIVCIPFSHTPPAFAAFTSGMLEDSAFCKAFQKNMQSCIFFGTNIVNVMSIFFAYSRMDSIIYIINLHTMLGKNQERGICRCLRKSKEDRHTRVSVYSSCSLHLFSALGLHLPDVVSVCLNLQISLPLTCSVSLELL